MDKSDYLRHHGIRGQKWGVRRFQNKDGTLTSSGRKRYADNGAINESHEDYKKAHSPKNAREMSDAELRSRLNRLQMETQYSQLMKNKKTISRGSACVGKVLKAGTTVATLTTTALTIYNNFDKIKKIVGDKLGG